jgi:hypothetical protein
VPDPGQDLAVGAKTKKHTPGAKAPLLLRLERPKAKALGYLDARAKYYWSLRTFRGLSYSLGDSKAKAEYRGCIGFADAAKAFGVPGGKGQYRSCVGLAESVKALKCLEA